VNGGNLPRIRCGRKGLRGPDAMNENIFKRKVITLAERAARTAFRQIQADKTMSETKSRRMPFTKIATGSKPSDWRVRALDGQKTNRCIGKRLGLSKIWIKDTG
jgi:hypothetical protein